MRKKVFLLLFLLLFITPTAAQPDDDLLHVPSPDWRDQVIYFILTDRFNDGDPTNNNQGAGEYDPADRRRYSGGDLQGIINQIDYIQGLGATAIWITPPVAHQWWDPVVGYGGYHGYWAHNFTEVDPHYGDLTTYQALSRALHAEGMYLIQDIVLNHTGNFFTYPDGWNPNDPADGVAFNPNTVPVTAPSQEPFNLNDPTNPEHLAANIYNWTPNIQNYDDEFQVVNWTLADLDDLNTQNPIVQAALRDSYTYWIENVGIDGFRIDTVKHVERDVWNSFIHGEAGVNAVAAATGREDFLSFGEVYYGSAPYEDNGERYVASFLGDDALPSVLNFPMHYTIHDVFAAGAPTAHMTYRLDAAARVYPDVTRLPVFIDNHDVDRFLASGSTAALKQALMFMMTTPGIPIIYYGTEQGFAERRAAMFAEGYASGGEDHFDTTSGLYRFTADVTNLRTSNRIFTRGTLTTLPANERNAGVLAYTREYEGDVALVLFNTADAPILVNALPIGLPAGTLLTNLYGIHGDDGLTVGVDGTITTELPAREGLILLASGETATIAAPDTNISITTNLSTTQTEDVIVSGTTTESGATVRLLLNDLVVDETTATDDGTWAITLPIQNFPLGTSTNTVQAYTAGSYAVSDAMTFETDVAFVGEPVTVSDPTGDDAGPYGIYRYPTDETFTQQMDIVEASYTVSGTNLLLEFNMGDLTTIWNPANGFDHTLFHIFVDIPGRDGVQVLPNLNATFANDFAWDILGIVEGWNIWNFAAVGANTTNYGTPLTTLPSVAVEDDIIRILFPSAALGTPNTLEGVRIYVSTWDWDGPAGGYRGLVTPGGQWVFGGADARDGFPLIMDDITLGWQPATSVLALDPERVALYNRTEYDITVNVSVPESTPDDASLFVTGAFNSWSPNDPNYQLTLKDNGAYSITIQAREGDNLQFRITRGSFANAEVLDPNSRIANHELNVTSDTTLNITVSSWWDD